MKAITIKSEVIGDSTFYINETFNKGILGFNFNRVNEKTNRTYHYKNERDYNKAIKRANRLTLQDWQEEILEREGFNKPPTKGLLKKNKNNN